LSESTGTFQELLRVGGAEIDTNSAVKDIIHFLRGRVNETRWWFGEEKKLLQKGLM
jgi:hypothetical protein